MLRGDGGIENVRDKTHSRDGRTDALEMERARETDVNEGEDLRENLHRLRRKSNSKAQEA